MGDRTAPGPPPRGRVCAGTVCAPTVQHGRRKDMCFQRSGIARSTWDPKFRITTIYFIPPNVQVKTAGFRQIPGRAGGAIFSKNGGKDSGQKRSVWVAEGLVGLRGKPGDGHFQVGVNGRVFSSGSRESMPKTPHFTPGGRPCPHGMHP